MDGEIVKRCCLVLDGSCASSMQTRPLANRTQTKKEEKICISPFSQPPPPPFKATMTNSTLESQSPMVFFRDSIGAPLSLWLRRIPLRRNFLLLRGRRLQCTYEEEEEEGSVGLLTENDLSVPAVASSALTQLSEILTAKKKRRAKVDWIILTTFH